MSKLMSKKLFLFVIFVLLPASVVFPQTRTKTDTMQKSSPPSAIKSSPAYAELILRKVERESELEALTLDYTDEFPKIKEFKFELDLINRAVNRISMVNAADTGKLTLALGKLLVRKIEVEIELWNLQMQYKEENAEIKRAKRKIEIFERAIKEILP